MNRYRRRGAVGTIYVARLSRGLYKVAFAESVAALHPANIVVRRAP